MLLVFHFQVQHDCLGLLLKHERSQRLTLVLNRARKRWEPSCKCWEQLPSSPSAVVLTCGQTASSEPVPPRGPAGSPEVAGHHLSKLLARRPKGNLPGHCGEIRVLGKAAGGWEEGTIRHTGPVARWVLLGAVQTPAYPWDGLQS